MTQIFPTALGMSAMACPVILAVLLARLALKKAPRAVTCALWLAVLFRLLCPWSPESRYMGVPSQLPAAETLFTTATVSEPAPMDEVAAETVHAAAAPAPSQAASAPDWRQLSALLWLLGMAALTAHSLASLLRLRRRLVGAVRLRGNIYLADHLETAFVLGLVRPKIYLPSSLPDREQACILAHEQAHIRRGDPLWKVLAYLALTIHWFNPLVWPAFFLACRDLETACDEAVLRKLGPEIEADYASALLSLATGRRFLIAAPLAFGEGDTGGRVRHILKFKKPAVWAVLLSAIAVLALGLVLIFQRTARVDYWNARYTVADIVYAAPEYDFTYTVSTAPEYAILPDGSLYAADTGGRSLIYADEWTYTGTLVPVELDRQARNDLFLPSDSAVQQIMADVTAVYEAQWELSETEQTIFHYLMVTRQGTQYLAVGHSRDRVRWLFQLACQAGSGDLTYLDLVLRQQLGMHPVGFSLFESDSFPNTQLVGWTDGDVIGFSELLYEEIDGKRTYTAIGTSGWASGSSAEIYPLAYAPQNGKDECLIVLSRNEGLETLVYSYGGETGRETVIGFPSMTVLHGPKGYAQAVTVQYLDRLGNAIDVDADFNRVTEPLTLEPEDLQPGHTLTFRSLNKAHKKENHV